MSAQKYEMELREATRLADAGELDEAYKIVDAQLAKDPNEPLALLICSHILEKAKKSPIAYSIAKRVSELRPERPEGWINLGRCADNLWRLEEAIACYKKALELCDATKQKLLILTNLAAALMQDARYEEAEHICRQALLIDPQDHKCRHNLGVCLLARHEWADGWKYYSASIGTDSRKQFNYKDEPTWDGSRGKTVVIYGEQGIGDEIVFASMVPDALRTAKKVILDVDARLAGLFARSFPQAKVYGTRALKEDDGTRWAPEDRQLDASISSGEIGKFYRRLDSDFSAAPYLTACPDRTLMWKRLFAEKRKPCIGIAWTGGAWHTGALYRSLELQQLLPILNAVDAHWVSLQYRDASIEVKRLTVEYSIDLKQYAYATLTKDYDDTAALVASLDLVVSVPTAVVHLAGALGVPTIAMQSPKPCWKFVNGLAWHPKVKLIPNTGWTDTLHATAQAIREHFQ